MHLVLEKITQDYRFCQEAEELAREAFPPEEYLAPARLLEMARADNFDFLALLDGENFVGFMVVQTHKELAYLFFLAIAPACRSQGYGSRALAALRAEYPDKKQVVDFEMPDARAKNSAQRQMRREFYLRNGYGETGLFLNYLGVDYEVFCMDEDFDAAEFQEMLRTLKIDGFHPKYFRRE